MPPTIKLAFPFAKIYVITQRWGDNPAIYKQWGYLGHNGIDYGTPLNTLLLSSANGVVRKIGWDPTGYGNYVVISHPGNFDTLYAHLNTIYAFIQPGFKVTTGMGIGLSGSTGNSTGPHLHYGLKDLDQPLSNGYAQYIDPTQYLSEVVPPAKQVSSSLVFPEGLDEKVLNATIVADGLRMRYGPGTTYPIMAMYNRNAPITTSVQKTSDGMNWAFVQSYGWVALGNSTNKFVEVSK